MRLVRPHAIHDLVIRPLAVCREALLALSPSLAFGEMSSNSAPAAISNWWTCASKSSQGMCHAFSSFSWDHGKVSVAAGCSSNHLFTVYRACSGMVGCPAIPADCDGRPGHHVQVSSLSLCAVTATSLCRVSLTCVSFLLLYQGRSFMAHLTCPSTACVYESRIAYTVAQNPGDCSRTAQCYTWLLKWCACASV